MSREHKGEDRLESIQVDLDRFSRLVGELDVARKQTPVNEARIKDLKEELDQLRDRVDEFRAMQASAGVGSSSQSKSYRAGCVRRFASVSFVSKVYAYGC